MNAIIKILLIVIDGFFALCFYGVGMVALMSFDTFGIGIVLMIVGTVLIFVTVVVVDDNIISESRLVHVFTSKEGFEYKGKSYPGIVMIGELPSELKEKLEGVPFTKTIITKEQLKTAAFREFLKLNGIFVNED